MSPTIEAPPVAKKRTLISIKIEVDVYRLAKTAAAWRGMDIAKYVSDAIRPIAARDCAKIGRDVGTEDQKG